ncbi:MAG TPA: lysophospholipid acyltransferase family protein [Bryobacteraceae bacterium]|nr:lysophospholipid acyltransferase family protein [Bryobacteraceae bacterium]
MPLELVSAPPRPVSRPLVMPRWNRSLPARLVRDFSHATWINWFTHTFARMRVDGLEHLRTLSPPVIFAANHQSHFDTPVLFAALPRRWRRRLAPLMLKDYFHAHFHPEEHSRAARLSSGTQYYLSALLFGAFPLPQNETGLRTALRYAAELAAAGWSLLIFPEGQRNDTGEMTDFLPGVGLLAARLKIPVVPVRLRGTGAALPKEANMIRRAAVEVRFGPPLRLAGRNYEALADQIERAVRAL